MKRAALLTALALVCACGPKSALDELTGEEKDAFDRATSSHVVVHQAVSLTDELFSFDPTLDPARSANENAGLIQAYISTELNGCGQVTLTNAAVVVQFGQAPGCTLPNGQQVSGTASLGVSKQNATLTVTVNFNNLTVDGKDLTGNATMSTSNGSTFSVQANLAQGSTTINLGGATTQAASATITGTPTGITLDGAATATRSAATTKLTFTTVYWARGDCYPSSGSVKVTKGTTEQTYTFTTETPSTGQVDLALGRKTVKVPLPEYGNCPPNKDGGM
jgi:hypothetical protein